MSLKEKIYNKCFEIITSRITLLKQEIQALGEAALTETKSTVGDKHETGRAMLQLEQEKLGNQLRELESQLDELKRIDPVKKCLNAARGALLNTDKGWLFLGVGLGKIKIEEDSVFALSLQSPLGIKIAGAKAGSKVEMNGVVYLVKEIF